MAIDTALRRLSIIDFGVESTLSYPDGSVDIEDRYALLSLYAGNISAAPVWEDVIGNISAGFDTGEHSFDIAFFFSGGETYAIDPAVETGWTFDTNTGLLTIDTDDEGVFGPYTVTATNASGSTAGNPFIVKVSASTQRAYRGVRGGSGVRRYT